MPADGRSLGRPLEVHFLPALVPSDHLTDQLVVVVDILRATTTLIHALSAGAQAIVPVADLDDARAAAAQLPADQRLLVGERDGEPPEGFDLGNSPLEFLPEVCHDKILICTTTNGTAAMVHAQRAARVLLGAFANFSAICQELRSSPLPVHILCAGNRGQIALEDVVFAGAVVDALADRDQFILNDSARIAWDAYEHHGQVLISALEMSANGQHLLSLGRDDDVKAAVQIDTFSIVPEIVHRQPLTIAIGTFEPTHKLFSGQTGLW